MPSHPDGGTIAAMDEHTRKRHSRRMSLVLRHQPERVGLQLDAAGWVPVADLLAALGLSRDQLDEILRTNDKQRFAVRTGPDGTDHIRANQGHSVPVDLGLATAAPPDLLFHGTSASALASIRSTGLHRGSRHHVHLSPDRPTAQRVGARRSGPVVILAVDAAGMARDGHTFHRSDNGVWLTDAVPPAYLTVS